MIAPRHVRKVLLPLGLVAGVLVLAGNARASLVSRRLTTEFEIALFLMKSSDPTEHVNRAITGVEDASRALGLLVVPPRTPPNKLGRLVLHDRSKVRRALIVLTHARAQIMLGLRRDPFSKALRAAETDLSRSIFELKSALRMPFIL
jgi:hypothetical protein